MEDRDYKKKVDSLHLAVFGDDETKTMGMLKKVDIIFDIFTKGKTGITFVGWTILSIITLGLFFTTVKVWFVALAHQLLKY